MEDKSASSKINILESKITILDNKIGILEKNEEIENNSIISLFLDIFNFKRFIELIFRNQNVITTTNKFIDSVLLLLFLLVVFYGTGSLKFEWSSITYTLLAIFIIVILELIGANTAFFKRFFKGNEKTKHFLKNVNSMSINEVKDDIKLQNFSAECVNYFIRSLEDKNKYPPNVVDVILDSEFLRKENLDLLFKRNILKNIHPQLINKILIQKQNSLTEENIIDIYSTFNDNDVSVIKMLFATQSHSDCLSKLNSNDTELNNYFIKYQLNREHFDWILKIIPISKLESIRKKILILLYLIFLIVIVVDYGSTLTIPIQFEDFVAIFIAPFMLIAFINLIIAPIFTKIYDYYCNHFINSVVDKS